MLNETALKAVTTGKLRTLTRDESLRVGRAVDALLARRSELYMDTSAALVLGELAVRIRCDPPYLLEHVRIRPTGALGKLIDPLRAGRHSSPEEQARVCEENGIIYGGFAAASVLT